MFLQNEQDECISECEFGLDGFVRRKSGHSCWIEFKTTETMGDKILCR